MVLVHQVGGASITEGLSFLVQTIKVLIDRIRTLLLLPSLRNLCFIGLLLIFASFFPLKL